MTGKEKCQMLRNVRRKAAELNEIEYNFKGCTHKGPCEGVCAFCDKELRELEALIEERRAEGLPVYMEYMFSVPEPEMPTHRNSFAARLKRFVSRVKGGGLRSPFDRQVEGMAGIIAPKLEIPPRERDEARLKEVVERYNRVCKPLFEAEESLAKGGKP